MDYLPHAAIMTARCRHGTTVKPRKATASLGVQVITRSWKPSYQNTTAPLRELLTLKLIVTWISKFSKGCARVSIAHRPPRALEVTAALTKGNIDSESPSFLGNGRNIIKMPGKPFH